MDSDPLRSPTPPWQPLPFARWVWRLARDVAREYGKDGVGDLAAAITFWTILSIPAAALSLVSILGSLEAILGQSVADDVQREIERLVSDTFTAESAINDTVSDLFTRPGAGVATLATMVALFTLSRAFAGLIRALDIAYEVEDGRPFWYVRIVAIGLGVSTVAVVAAGATALALLPDLPFSDGLRWLVAPAVVVGLVLWATTLFHIGPYHRTPWRFDLPGAVVTAVGWVAATQGFALYVRLFPGGNDIRTSVGAILLALTLMYFLSVVMLVGAEVNDVISRRAGVVHQPPPVNERAKQARDRWRRRIEARVGEQ